jgi:hypothetical protein
MALLSLFVCIVARKDLDGTSDPAAYMLCIDGRCFALTSLSGMYWCLESHGHDSSVLLRGHVSEIVDDVLAALIQGRDSSPYNESSTGGVWKFQSVVAPVLHCPCTADGSTLHGSASLTSHATASTPPARSAHPPPSPVKRENGTAALVSTLVPRAKTEPDAAHDCKVDVQRVISLEVYRFWQKITKAGKVGLDYPAVNTMMSSVL